MANPAINFAGFLYNDAGTAVSGATVNLYDKNTTTNVRAETTTDSNGAWSIAHTTAGEFDIEIVSGASKRRIKFDDKVHLSELDAETINVRANEGGDAPLYFFADEGDDAGDRWEFKNAAGGVFTMGNDINSQNTYVAHVTITPNSTVASSTFAIAGNATVGGALTVTGTTTLNGNLVLGDAVATDTLSIGATLSGGTPLVFEGATADGHETSFVITDPTSDHDIVFPDLGGTVLLSGNPISGTTIDASTDFTIGSTVITDGVITDSSGLQLAANLDVNGTVDISGDLTLSAGGDGALVFATAGENSIKIPDNQGSALIVEEADNAYMTFVTTDSSEAVSIAKTLTLGTVAAAGTDTDKFLVLDSSGNVDYRTGSQVLSDIGGGTGGMTSFILEDEDGTEVTISNAKEVKIIGSGVTTNWTDVDNGTDGDPYDLTITVDTAQTGIESVYNASLKLGRDADNLVDFATTDNKIIFRVEGVDEVELVQNALSPITSDGVSLGTSSLMWSDLFVANGSVINFNNGDVLLTHSSNLITVTGGGLVVGVDDTGHDVKFFGASAGAYMEWDESADQLRIMGASADATTSTGKLLLATSLTDINANDVLGKIEFQAPHEAGGTDAITVAAGIEAIAQGTFSASVNSTDLVFKTGHSEAATEKFRITSQGELGVGGANYGTDGQVLTSTGAGTAPAWEDLAAGGGSTTLEVASGKTITPGMAVGVNSSGKAVPFLQDGADYTHMTDYQPETTKYVQNMQVGYDTETDLHVGVYVKTTTANVNETANIYAVAFSVDANDNITFGTELQISTEQVMYGRLTLEYMATKNQFLVAFARGDGSNTMQDITGYLLKPVAGSPTTVRASAALALGAGTDTKAYAPGIADASDGSDHRMVVSYSGASYYPKARVLNFASDWDEGAGNAHNVTIGSETNLYSSASYYRPAIAWMHQDNSGNNGTQILAYHYNYVFGFDIGSSGVAINTITTASHSASTRAGMDIAWAGTAGEAHVFVQAYASYNTMIRVSISASDNSTSQGSSGNGLYNSVGSGPSSQQYMSNVQYYGTTDKFVAIHKRSAGSTTAYNGMPGTDEFHGSEMEFQAFYYHDGGDGGNKLYGGGSSDAPGLAADYAKCIVNPFQGNNLFSNNQQGQSTCYNPDRNRIIVAVQYGAHDSSNLPPFSTGRRGQAIYMIKSNSDFDDHGTLPEFVGFSNAASDVTGGSNVELTITGGTNSRQNSLTVGAKYFLDSFGNLNPYGPLPVSRANVFAGVALSATELLVDGNIASAPYYKNR